MSSSLDASEYLMVHGCFPSKPSWGRAVMLSEKQKMFRLGLPQALQNPAVAVKQPSAPPLHNLVFSLQNLPCTVHRIGVFLLLDYFHEFFHFPGVLLILALLR